MATGCFEKTILKMDSLNMHTQGHVFWKRAYLLVNLYFSYMHFRGKEKSL